jgi:type IV secretory pathway TrbL component
MQNERFRLLVTTLVVLAVIGLAAYVVTVIGGSAVIAGVLVAITGMLTAVPPIIRALRGDAKEDNADLWVGDDDRDQDVEALE